MNERFILELIGYVGSAFVLISFLMATVIKLRVINSIGSLISVAYGVLIHAYPTVVMNAALLVINIFYLVKMYRFKESFHVVAADLKDSSVQFFLDLNKEDIAAYFPDFAKLSDKTDFLRLICCENKMVGLFAARKQDDKTLNILLDYTIKEYRDYSVGYYLYKALTADKIETLNFEQNSLNHDKYLKKMGFVQAQGSEQIPRYTKQL